MTWQKINFYLGSFLSSRNSANFLFAMPIPAYLILFFLFEVHSILKCCHAKRKPSQVNIMVNVLNSGVGDHTTALFANWKNFAYQVTKCLSFFLSRNSTTFCRQCVSKFDIFVNVFEFWISNHIKCMRMRNLVTLCGKTCRIIW